MQIDNGEVLPGLNENWTFLGANAMEWVSGFMMFLIISLFGATPARSMPFMIGGWIGTTVIMASIRKNFPDEERGVRNALLTTCGLPPPGIPAPAKLQPIWSGCPMRSVPEQSKFAQYGFGQILPSFENDARDAEVPGQV